MSRFGSSLRISGAMGTIMKKWNSVFSKAKEFLDGRAGKDHNIVRSGKPGPARAYLDLLSYDGENFLISGWLFSLEYPADVFLLKINDTVVGSAASLERSDVAKAFRNFNFARLSGFSFKIPLARDTFSDWAAVDIIGIHNEKEIGHVSTLFRDGFYTSLPTPPPKLTKRVSSFENPAEYWTSAAMSFGEFYGAIKRFRHPSGIKRLLDWGCGCGRLSSMFMNYSPVPEVYGCDIDTEAIDWCRNNLTGGAFSSINLNPPIPFQNDFFDVIIGFSVFTHLTRVDQVKWLKEMRRILAPGGLFVTSVHGEFAANFVPNRIRTDMMENGISDASLDSNLDGVAPEGYYRAVFQTRAYTEKEWSHYFYILDHIEGGVSNYQDMVILEKKVVESPVEE
jgi:SAM-dependent methyltransferase